MIRNCPRQCRWLGLMLPLVASSSVSRVVHPLSIAPEATPDQLHPGNAPTLGDWKFDKGRHLRALGLQRPAGDY